MLSIIYIKGLMKDFRRCRILLLLFKSNFSYSINNIKEQNTNSLLEKVYTKP